MQEAVDTIFAMLADPLDPAFVRGFAPRARWRAPYRPSFWRVMVQENLKAPARVWRETMAGILEEEFADDLGRIAAPTLVVWGDQDRIRR